MQVIRLESKSKIQFIDITSQIWEIIRLNNWQNGICTIFSPHTTSGITINENADPDLKDDMVAFFKGMFPQTMKFKHSEGNTDGHLLSSLVGCSETVIVQHCEPMLGTWQGIYFCEFDGPRRRDVYVQFVGQI